MYSAAFLQQAGILRLCCGHCSGFASLICLSDMIALQDTAQPVGVALSAPMSDTGTSACLKGYLIICLCSSYRYHDGWLAYIPQARVTCLFE